MKNSKLFKLFLLLLFSIPLFTGCADDMIGTGETRTRNIFSSRETSWEWDILDKSMVSWDVDDGLTVNRGWILSKGKHTPGSIVSQRDGHVNLTKTNTGLGDNYAFLVPPALTLQSNTAYTLEVKARVNPLDKAQYPDEEGVGFESNQISARLNGRNLAIHLKHGDDNSGYITIGAGVEHVEEEIYRVNTSEWHVYRFVFHANNLTYDVYLDDIKKPIFTGVQAHTMSGSNILRLGAETRHRCNMDIEHARMGTGNFNSKPEILSLSLSSDSHIANQERTVSVTVNTALINDNEKLLLSLVDENDATVVDQTEVMVVSDKVIKNFTIPTSVPIGRYSIKVSVPGNAIDGVEIEPKTAQYVVTGLSPITSRMLPQVSPVRFIKSINDYVHQPVSKEFIFPSILDIKEFTPGGKFLNGEDILDRYYLFYTPHENPGGMYLMTAPTLDGPWKEQGTVIDLEWAKAVPGNIINTADHISACQVVWNDIHDKYFMYFHGPNSATHYATSENLVDWEFGATVVTSRQFSPIGQEASYAKLFEHEIPGLNNKYVLILMNQEGGIRRIYWAHSNDGVDWTPVQKPLISPDLNYKKIPGTDIKPDYSGSFGNNVAGPYLMEINGRYFVFVNGSSGHIFVVEVGKSFDMEVHWGEYMKASDVVIDTDENSNTVAVPRIAAPSFIKSDEGKWYMFFEAGSRLGANIAYAKEGERGNPVSPKNYKIQSVNVSCPGSNDGQILVSMEEALNYTVRVTSSGFKETKQVSGDSYTLYGLKAGVYSIQFEVDGYPESRQYFQVMLAEPSELSVLSSSLRNSDAVYELSGGIKYRITHNNITTEMSGDSVRIPLQKGKNTIRIAAEKDCQGVFEEVIYLD